MLAAIGETLESEKDKEIMGVVVNVRKAYYRIGLWTKTIGGKGGQGNKEALMEIGRKFKDVLRLGEKDTIEFSGHTESAQSGQSRAKAKYMV
jgi:Eukaryotic initiation factor 4E